MDLGRIVKGKYQIDNSSHAHRLDWHRVELQRAFFPLTYRDMEVSPPLIPGDKRMWTEMRVLIELRGCTTFYIPFREPSKVV